MSVQPVSTAPVLPVPRPRALHPAPGRSAAPRPSVHMTRTTVGPVSAVLTLFPAEALPAGQDAERLNAELQAFVRHLLRRPTGSTLAAVPPRRAIAAAPGPEGLGRDGLPRLDRTRRRLDGPAGGVRLSGREAALLAHLEDNRGRTVSRRELLDVVWGWDSATATRTVDVHIARLRRKLGDRAGLLRTVVGAGYVYG